VFCRCILIVAACFCIMNVVVREGCLVGNMSQMQCAGISQQQICSGMLSTVDLSVLSVSGLFLFFTGAVELIIIIRQFIRRHNMSESLQGHLNVLRNNCM